MVQGYSYMEIETTGSRQLPSRRTGPAPVRRDDLEALHRRDHHGLLPRQRARRERGLAPEEHRARPLLVEEHEPEGPADLVTYSIM